MSKLSKNSRLIFALIIWIPCFIIFLNLYPGTLSCDTPHQLAEAMLDSEFENANPLLNTLILTFFVQIGCRISGVNLGIALYTFFQLTLYAIATSFCVEVFWKRGFNKLFVLASLVFYAVNPINLLYAVGMWKDSFFAILFVATIAYIFDNLDVKLNWKKSATLFLLALAASLARNSGWSSLLVFAVILLIHSLRHKEKNTAKIAMYVGSAAVISLVIAFVLLPAIGIGNGGSNVARSIPLQQIARTATDNELDESEIQELNGWLVEGYSCEDIPANYRADVSDPMKGIFDGYKIRANGREFNAFWIKLGMKYKKSYVDAVIDHTKPYWWPGAQIWRFDNIIFDNPYGVVRSSIIKPGVDVGATLYESYFSKIPFYKEWNSGAIVLWLILAGLICSIVRKKPVSAIMYVIPLMIFVGLMPVSPAALFRYMYGAVLAKPFLLAFQFIRR